MNRDAHSRIAVLHDHVHHATLVEETPLGNLTLNGELLYSVSLPEELHQSSWQVHRHPKEFRKLRTGYDPPDDGIQTTYDSFETTVSQCPEAQFLGTRETDAQGRPGRYLWMSYSEAADQRTAIGSAMLGLGLGKGSKVGLCSANCQEWVLVDLACHAYNMVTVPLYDTLGPDAVNHIMRHAELEAVACSATVLPSILECVAENKGVKLVIVYGLESGKPLSPTSAGQAAQVVRFPDLIELGKKTPRIHIPPAPQDLALLCYTSGTTGVPKGAMISHGNLTCTGASLFLVPKLRLRRDDVHISYLPLAHIYERGNITGMIRAGGAIGFYRGDVLTLLDDVQELRPTVFTSVPRLYNRIYDRVQNTIKSGNPISRALFHRAYSSKLAALKAGDLSGGKFGAMWDRLVFSKVQARLGGRVRIMASGSAPLASDVMDFLRVCFGCIVIEGYGLTETSSGCCATFAEEHRSGHVGGVGPSIEMKLVDIPDMNYTVEDIPNPRGEICVRGPLTFQGYYKDEKNTAEAFDEAGWFHTGDIGEWLSGGRLKIIDRKKAMFKLAQGEYVAAEKIENILSRSQFVAQAFVYGDSLKSQLVAIIVPDPEVLLPWAATRGLPSDLEKLCKIQSVQSAVFRSIGEEGRAAQLRGFEQAAAIHLCSEPFTIQNGLQTPTFKLKRAQARDKFRTEIEKMYDSLN